ncbi:autophagy protein 5 [Cryptosporidium felis]|nr:autophagy protein 5 [Cryptosporidium felis]
MSKILDNELYCLTHKVIHSGLILVSITIDIRNGEEFPKLRSTRKSYFIVPRIGYLVALVEQIRDHYCSIDGEFIKLIENNSSWFEFNGSIINSEYPIGLLFDLYSENNESLIFKLNLVFHERSNCREDLKNTRLFDYNYNYKRFTKVFTNNIKLSQTIMYGSCRKFQMLSKRQFEGLFHTVLSLSKTTNQYESMIEILFGSPREIFMNIINIPVKIHVQGQIFLRSFKKEVNGELFEIKGILYEISGEISVNYENIAVIFQGITLPLETPLIMLAIFCSYPDGIIQITLRDNLSCRFL